MLCRAWLAQLEQHRQELEDAGLRVVAVGLGEPKHARVWCPRLAPSHTCLCTPDGSAHAAYGLRRGTLGQAASLGTLRAGARALAAGQVQGKATGDQAMLSATFIIDAAGTIRWAYYSRHPGDDPSLEAIRSAAVSPA